MAWVGNIRQKFETICNGVDNIVGQDAVKYVENKVHNVGENMKKFCSGVVQDLIPPSVDSLKCEAQAVALKTNDATSNDFQSIINIDEDHGRSSPTKQSPLQPSDLDLLVEHLGNSFSRQHPVNESTTNGQLELGTLLENVDKGLETECVDASPEESSLKKLIPPHDKYFSEANGQFTGLDYENEVESLAEAFSAISFHREELQPTQVVAPACDNSADNSYFVHYASSTVTLPKLDFSVASSEKGLAPEELDNISRNEDGYVSAEDSALTEKSLPLIPPAEKECFEATNGFIESDRENECEFMAEAMFSNSVYEEESQSAQIVGTDRSADGSNFVSNASGVVIFPAKDFWVAPSGKGVGEMELACSISSMGQHDLSDNPLGNIPANILSCCNPVNSAGHDFDGSGVVQDLFSPSVDSLKFEALVVSLKKNHAIINNYFQSIVNIDEDHGCSSPTKQLPLQPSHLDFVVEQPGDSFSREHPVNESTTCTHGLSLEVGTFLENVDESLKTEYVGASPKEKLIPPADRYFVEANGQLTGLHYEKECEFLAESLSSTSVHREELQPTQAVAPVCDHSVDNSFFVHYASSNVVASSKKGLAPEELDKISRNEDGDVSVQDSACVLIFPAEKGCYEATNQFIDCDSGNECGFVAKAVSPTSVYEEWSQSAQIVGTDHSAANSYCVSDAPGVVTFSEIDFSVASLGKGLGEMELACSTNSMGHDLSDNPLENIPGNILSCSNPVNSAGSDFYGSVSLKSYTFSPTVSCKIKEMGLTSSNCVLSTKSIGCYGDSSCIGNDLTDSKMENIDLSDKARLDVSDNARLGVSDNARLDHDFSNKTRLEKSCVIIDDRSLYEVSHRIPKFRSFKKKIQDAFTSKKRIIKEYERLGILYWDLEDLDIESSHETMPKELSSSTTTTIADSASRISGIQDSEWELL